MRKFVYVGLVLHRLPRADGRRLECYKVTRALKSGPQSPPLFTNCFEPSGLGEPFLDTSGLEKGGKATF